MLRTLVERQPLIVEHRRRLAQTLNNYAGLLVDLDRPFEAVEATAESVALQRRLVDAAPERPSLRLNLLATLGNHAWLMACLGRTDQCKSCCEEARRLIAGTDGDVLDSERRQAALDHLARIEQLSTRALPAQDDKQP